MEKGKSQVLLRPGETQIRTFSKAQQSLTEMALKAGPQYRAMMVRESATTSFAPRRLAGRSCILAGYSGLSTAPGRSAVVVV